MKVFSTKFKGLKVIKGENHLDRRGAFREVFIKNKMEEFNGIFWCMSKSKKNVVRGLHIQKKNNQAKYISVIKGKIFDVAIDLRKVSKTYGKVHKCILSEKNKRSIFIPQGFAHGFQSLDNENYIIYSCTKYRNKKSFS